MNGLEGTALLLRFIARRDRVRVLVWAVAIVALIALTAASVKGLYPTQADLDEAAAASEGNAAAIAFNGPALALNTVGGQIVFQVSSVALVTVGLMSLLMIGRLTRGEEEAGRLEMLRALPIGVHAPTAAAWITVTAMNLFIGVLVALTLAGLGLPGVGSVTMGGALALFGVLFATLALLAAQITENTRVVYGITGSVLAAAFLLRAIGDAGNHTISWLSPIGWAQRTQPYAGERWWPFLVTVAATAAAALASGGFATRRDLGAGLVAPRRGPEHADPALGRPLGLALRLQRGTVVGWSIGVLIMGAAYGAIAPSIDEFIGNNKALAEMMARAGGASLVDSYLATSFRIVALIGAGFAVQSTLRLRGEESGQRAEPVLATPVSRRRWAMSHLTMACAGSVVMLLVAGVSVGAGYGIAGHTLSRLPAMIGAAVVYAPAMWLLVGFAVAIIGFFPRATVVAWVVLIACLVVGFLGDILGLPGWTAKLSPFENVPQLPAAGFSAVSPLVLTGLAMVLMAAGLFGLDRRDIGTTGR